MVKKIKKISKSSSWLSPAILGLIFLAVTGFLVLSNFRINQKRSALLGEIDGLQKQIQEIQDRNDQLRSGISNTETQSYWEERMREQGYKKTGEEAVVVLPSENGQASSTESSKNFLQKIWEKLGL